ncbi:hypothetical protein Hypma_005190 [Hypsizygus marmoreus]|uniref:Uncharacterized protein n=1 Tax=Hypsizygus marmoreus TaxID=39966 RepID=A0A369J160_HYPMA|nr:hypothetical protein Hypma_005190 [Hypsizygus marmoreus]
MERRQRLQQKARYHFLKAPKGNTGCERRPGDIHPQTLSAQQREDAGEPRGNTAAGSSAILQGVGSNEHYKGCEARRNARRHGPHTTQECGHMSGGTDPIGPKNYNEAAKPEDQCPARRPKNRRLALGEERLLLYL